MAATIVAVTSAETCGVIGSTASSSATTTSRCRLSDPDVAQPEGDVGEQVQRGAADERRRR